MFSSQIYCVTFVNHRCTGGFTYFALHFIHATFCIEPRNRSIEHIAPQTPKENSTLSLSNEDENCFGNLVMISSSQNSGLQNSTFEMKRSKVIDFIHNNLNGTIESLKMLLIYQYENWTTTEIYDHQEKCIKLLNDSFEMKE